MVSALAILMSVMLTFAVSASQATVFADEVVAQVGEKIFIPIRIRDNPGLMGFKIMISYDATILEAPTVSCGTVTQNGMLDSSIGVSQEGSFDVVWSTTADVKEDGTLMVLGFQTKKEGKTAIRISYSQEDTFNEKWEDVLLDCKDVYVTVSETDSATVLHGRTETETEKMPARPPNGKDILVASGTPTLFDAEGLLEVNKDLYSLTGTKDVFETVDEWETAYKEAVSNDYVDSVLSSINSEEIQRVVIDSLSAVNVGSLDEVTIEKELVFVQTVEAKLSQIAEDLGTVSDKLTSTESMNVIKQLMDSAIEEQDSGFALNDLNPRKRVLQTIIIVSVSFVLIAVAVVIAITYNKKRRKKDEKKI